MTRFALVSFGFVAVALCLGCTRGGPQIVAIEGTVTHEGKPLPDLMIYFQPASGRPSWAISDQKGHFVLDYDPDYDGAVVGNHTVWVLENPNASDPLRTQGKPRPKRSAELQAVLDKYGSVDKSPYKVEVKKADRNFQLKLD